MTLGEKISSLRKSKGISQELLAENSGVSLRTIQRIEAGDTTPRPYTVKVIAAALGVAAERLNPVEFELDPSNEGWAMLRLINLSALTGLILPFSNIIFPLILWRRNLSLSLVNQMGRRIISFQILWTLGTILILLITPFLIYSITGNVAIGRFPTLPFVYFTLLSVNLLSIVTAAISLKKENASFYSSIPSLF